jgi:hypothetical protein
MKLIIDYPEKRMLYLKPQSRKEFLDLYEQLFTAIEKEDLTAIKILVNQLMPIDVKEFKEGEI